jgi:hypothetical protein
MGIDTALERAPDLAPKASTEPIDVARPSSERSQLGWIVFGLMLLAVGGMAILASLGVIGPTPQQYPAVALLVLAAGLLVGTFVGRARWLILPAVLVTPLLLAASIVHVPLAGGFGDRYLRPAAGEAPRTVRAAAGKVSLDLSRLRGSDAVVPITASTAFGSIDVTLPYDAHAIVHASSGLGRLRVGGPSKSLFDATVVRRLDPKYGDGAMIELDLAVGIGDVQVAREWLSKKQRRELGIRGNPR